MHAGPQPPAPRPARVGDVDLGPRIRTLHRHFRRGLALCAACACVCAGATAASRAVPTAEGRKIAVACRLRTAVDIVTMRFVAQVVLMAGGASCSASGAKGAAAVGSSSHTSMHSWSNRSSAYPPGTCGVTGEYDQAQTIGCTHNGPDSTITGVSLANFGTPAGSCAKGFTPDPKCSKDMSAGILTLCKGKKTCAITCLGSVQSSGHPLTPRKLLH